MQSAPICVIEASEYRLGTVQHGTQALGIRYVSYKSPRFRDGRPLRERIMKIRRLSSRVVRDVRDFQLPDAGISRHDRRGS